MDVKFKPFEAYAKHPDSKIIPNVKSITDGHFAEIWEEIFSKKDTSFTIKSGKDPVINHTPSKEATEIAHLTAANGVLQRPGATSHITLNMKIGDFDWPIAEFVDKP